MSFNSEHGEKPTHRIIRDLYWKRATIHDPEARALLDELHLRLLLVRGGPIMNLNARRLERR